MSKSNVIIIAVIASISILAGGVLLSAQPTQPASPKQPQQQTQQGEEFNTPGGVGVVCTRAGEGARNGDAVFVHYTGRLTDGTQFDSSHDRGEPIDLILGAGQVIPGWEEGLQGMHVGEKRTLTIPPKLAYGDEGGGGGKIPPNATLVFDVELMGLQRK